MEGVETASCVARVMNEGSIGDIDDGQAHSGVCKLVSVSLDGASSLDGRPFGILCATWGETVPFLRCMRVSREVRRGPRSFFEGEFGGRGVVVACAGVGKVNAAMAAQQLVDTYPVWGVANAGAAGAADPRLELFDIVLSAECVHHDVPGFVLPDSYPYYSAESFGSDPFLLEGGVLRGRFQSGCHRRRMQPPRGRHGDDGDRTGVLRQPRSFYRRPLHH